jgi:hypothetical protein
MQFACRRLQSTSVTCVFPYRPSQSRYLPCGMAVAPICTLGVEARASE